MGKDGDDQLKLFYASKHNLQIVNGEYEPRWTEMPEPHTRCHDLIAAKANIDQLRKIDAKFGDKIFKAVRIRDELDIYNEFTS